MTQPLDGIRVLDFTQVFLGPSATQLLADHGADVIKIERPGTGELMRLEEIYRPENGGENAMFVSLNRSKRSIALNLRSDEGREIVRRLIRDADVLVHNFRPGVMARQGLEYEEVREINTRLIYAAASGYGPDGPLSHLPGQDSLAQAMAGVIPRVGEPDIPMTIYPTTFGDYTGGMHLTIGILLALRARELTGKGQRVDVSLYNSLLALQTQEAAVNLLHGEDLNWAQTPLSGVFETSDGALVLVGAFRENPLRDICQALDLEDLSEDERFHGYDAQAENRTELHGLLAARFAEGDTEHWLQRLRAIDILVAPVRTLAEALDEPQTAHNKMLVEFVQDGREVRMVASPVALSDTPAREPTAAPALSADADSILEEAGYDRDQVAALRDQGVIG